MRFGILGPFTVVDDEKRELALGGPRRRAVLAILVLNAGQVVSADQLADELWAQRPPKSAAKTVQVYISHLRRTLGERIIVTRAGGYVFVAPPGTVDADRFRAAVEAARTARSYGDSAQAAEELRGALAMWRGPALADFTGEPFAQNAIARLAEERLVALEERIGAELDLGGHAEVLGELRSLVGEHPLRERLRAQLMVALYRSGRQAEALDVYQTARAELTDTLGLEPGPELQALQVAILNHDPSLIAPRDWSGAGVGGDRAPSRSYRARSRARAAVPHPPTPLVGREEELDAAGRLLTSGPARLVSLIGPGGVGKTRLAMAVARFAAPRFVHGAVWVELAGVARPDDVAPAVARALAVTPVGGERAADALGRYLAGKHTLLVLDSFEHVLDAALLVSDLLSESAELRVLTTSREPLHLAAEHRFAVTPLALPVRTAGATVADVTTASATALFLAAAARRDRRFSATVRNAPAIAAICTQLEGLPLALELAAARTDQLTVDQLAHECSQPLSAVGTGPRDAPARHRSLEAAIDWSHRRLDRESAPLSVGLPCSPVAPARQPQRRCSD